MTLIIIESLEILQKGRHPSRFKWRKLWSLYTEIPFPTLFISRWSRWSQNRIAYRRRAWTCLLPRMMSYRHSFTFYHATSPEQEKIRLLVATNSTILHGSDVAVRWPSELGHPLGTGQPCQVFSYPPSLSLFTCTILIPTKDFGVLLPCFPLDKKVSLMRWTSRF